MTLFLLLKDHSCLSLSDLTSIPKVGTGKISACLICHWDPRQHISTRPISRMCASVQTTNSLCVISSSVSVGVAFYGSMPLKS
ncbi:unnamed protein product [Ixodes persulcatus]